MQKEVLFLHPTILGVIEMVENKPALDPLCLDMSEILSEMTLIPGLFTYPDPVVFNWRQFCPPQGIL